jgi:histidinol-phosphate aminotransferase
MYFAAQPPEPRPGLALISGPMAAIPQLAAAGTHRLCSNENPFGPGAAAITAATAALGRGGEYPEGEGGELVEALASRYGVAPGRIRLGPGSDTLVLNTVLAFAGPGDEVVFPAQGYARYARNALIAGATPVAVPGDDFRADPGRLLEAVTPRTRIVLLANPDNPSGAMLGLDAVTALHRQLPRGVLLVLDCAYGEYVRDPAYGDGGLALSADARNVVVSHTFSKLYGMAGLRLGWITGDPAVLDAVAKVGPTFPASAPALAAGLAALRDTAHQALSRSHNDIWLPWLADALAADPALRVRPSQSNFLLVDFPSADCARSCTEHLAEAGLLVRRFGPGAHAHQMRISIGDAAALRRAAALIAAFPKGD